MPPQRCPCAPFHCALSLPCSAPSSAVVDAAGRGTPHVAASGARGVTGVWACGAQKATKVAKKKAPSLKFFIDFHVPVQDNILDPGSFEKFLRDRIKVKGKAGALGDSVKINRDSKKMLIEAKKPFSKRYLKVRRPRAVCAGGVP